jgi:hypothetical protein
MDEGSLPSPWKGRITCANAGLQLRAEISLELCEQFRPLTQTLSGTLEQPENVQLPTGKAGAMANRHSSEGFGDGWGALASDDSSGNRAGSPDKFPGRDNMNVATKRTIIAAAALAAAGLFGSLPYDGTPEAQQGAPTVHGGVVLVDVSTVVTDAIPLRPTV